MSLVAWAVQMACRSYRTHRLSKLAAKMSEKAVISSSLDTKQRLAELAELHRVRLLSRSRLQLCCADLCQLLSLWLLAALGLLHMYGLIAVILVIVNEFVLAKLILYFMALYVAMIIYSIALALLAKWSLIGQYRPGVYQLWGSYHVRWWLTHNLLRYSAMGMFKQTSLAPVLFRMMGARVGCGEEACPISLS